MASGKSMTDSVDNMFIYVSTPNILHIRGSLNILSILNDFFILIAEHQGVEGIIRQL